MGDVRKATTHYRKASTHAGTGSRRARSRRDNLPQIEDMVAVCAGLVVVDEESGIIRLVHYTAQEYFKWAQTQRKWFPDAERDIAVACVTYLSFDIFSTGRCHNIEELWERLWSNPLYRYASCHWGHHACKYPAESVGVIKSLEDEKKVEASSQVWVADQSYQNPSATTTALHLASYFGIYDAVASLLPSRQDVDLAGTRGWTPLSYAAVGGHAVVIRLLLDKGADADRTVSFSTPLYWAAKNGHMAAMRVLLEKGADVNAISRGQTPLSISAKVGNADARRLFLNNDAVVDMKDDNGRTPLSHAAASGFEGVVRLLIENNAAVDMADEEGLTPLGHAAASGQQVVVRLLVDKGAAINTKEIEAVAPLLVTAYEGHEGIIRLLLDKGGEVEMTDPSDKTPLLLASEYRHGAAV